MFSSNSNNNKTDSHSTPPLIISIEVGCTGATSGPCDLSFERQSPNSPSKVKCVNDANCTNTMATYYYCCVHDSAICCNCAYREQQKEKQEKQKTNKYDDDNDLYMPEEGEIINEGDNEYKYNGPNSNSTKKKNKENKKRKLAPSESADKYEPQHKKRKLNFDLQDLANLTGNDVIKKVNEKQDEINQLNEYIRQQKRCTEKLEKQLKDKIAAYEKKFETYKRVMDKNDTLKEALGFALKQVIDKDKDLKTSEMKNSQFEKQRMDLKHARANWKHLEYMKAWNKFLDGNN